MLADSRVKAIVNGKEGMYKVGVLYEMWKNAYKGLAQHKIQVKAYNSMRRVFNWKELKKFEPLRENKRLVEITLEVGKTKDGTPIYMTITVNESINILSSSGGRTTFITASALQKNFGRKKPKVGLVEEDKLNFYPVYSITSIERDAIKVPAVKEKKRGRPKKKVEKPKVAINRDAYRAISNDTSYFICDGLVVR